MKKSLNKRIQRLTSHELLVTPKYTRWLGTDEARDATYPDWVIEQVIEQLKASDRDRSQSFSASASGTCMRRQVFEFLGAPSLDFDMDVISIFLTGNWNHMMWQAGMLASGAIEEIEVGLPMLEFRSMGTCDGQGVHDEYGRFGWEHKSANKRNFHFMLSREAPDEKHVRQAHRYMMASGLRLWSITYDCKEDQDWKEFVVPFDQDIADSVMDELVMLNQHVESKTLPVILDKCKDKEGPYRRCPFRNICLEAKPTDYKSAWPDDDHRVSDVLYPKPKRIRTPKHHKKLKIRRA